MYEIVTDGGMTYSVVLKDGVPEMACDHDEACEFVLNQLGVEIDQDQERFEKLYAPLREARNVALGRNRDGSRKS